MTTNFDLPPIVGHVSLEDLPQLWQAVAVEIVCTMPRGFDTGPALPGRLRGAWGQALMQEASSEALAGQPCPWSPPCALDILLRDRAGATAALALPKPWVIEAAPLSDRDLFVRLVLFGSAVALAGQAGDAMIRALRSGISGGGDEIPGRGRPHLEPSERTLRTVTVPDVADSMTSARAAVLRFVTPVVQRRGAVSGIEPVSLITGLGNRVSGLARWMGLVVEADWRSLKVLARGLSVDDEGLRGVRWMRRSGRQERIIPMEGYVGDLIIGGTLEPLMPLLALGTVTHAGSHAAHGLGCYDLELLA